MINYYGDDDGAAMRVRSSIVIHVNADVQCRGVVVEVMN